MTPLFSSQERRAFARIRISRVVHLRFSASFPYDVTVTEDSIKLRYADS